MQLHTKVLLPSLLASPRFPSPRLASPRLASLFPCPPPCLALHCPASCFPALPCAYPCPGSCFPCLRDPPVWPRSLACSAARWNYTTELNSITYTATFNRDGAPRSATGGRRGGGVAGMSLCGGGSLRRPPLKSLGVPLLDPPPHILHGNLFAQSTTIRLPQHRIPAV